MNCGLPTSENTGTGRILCIMDRQALVMIQDTLVRSISGVCVNLALQAV